MINKFCLLVAIVFLISNGAWVFGQEKDPNASEVLRCYKDSLSHLQSVSMNIEMEIEGKVGAEETAHIERHFSFRRDHNRAEWIGEVLELNNEGYADFSKSHVIKTIMTGKSYVNLSGLLKAPPLGAMITSNDKYYQETQKKLFDSPLHGGALWGKMYGNSHKNVAQLLGGSTNLYLRDEQENINSILCYVLEGTTEYGKITAWVAPERGYNALKWTIHKTGGDLFDETPLSVKWSEIESWLAVFDSVELQKVGDVFVTKGGNLTHTINFTDGRTSVSCHKYKVSEVEINPDFDALGAFKIDLPDGTRIYMKESPGIKYVWQSGKPVPADVPTFEDIDKMVEELKKEK